MPSNAKRVIITTQISAAELHRPQGDSIPNGRSPCQIQGGFLQTSLSEVTLGRATFRYAPTVLRQVTPDRVMVSASMYPLWPHLIAERYVRVIQRKLHCFYERNFESDAPGQR